MKKAIVLILIAIVAVSSAFAFKFKSVGIESGRGFYTSADMEIIDNLDAYVRLGFEDYISVAVFNLSFGAQYKVAEFKIGGTPVFLKPGAQIGLNFGDEIFMFSLYGSCAFQFETGHLTAFARPLIGFYTYPTYEYNYYTGERKKKAKASFAISIECGVAYLF